MEISGVRKKFLPVRMGSTEGGEKERRGERRATFPTPEKKKT